jgi:hypothetical protein
VRARVRTTSKKKAEDEEVEALPSFRLRRREINKHYYPS